MSRYLVGIDLGTTNIALAYVDTAEKVKAAGPKLHTFDIPQLIAAGDVGEQPLLPSFLYLPGPARFAPRFRRLCRGTRTADWTPSANSPATTGRRFPAGWSPPRSRGSPTPAVDRTAPLLPWNAPPEVPRLSRRWKSPRGT